MWAAARVVLEPEAQLRLAARHEDIGARPPCLKKAFSLPLHLHDEGTIVNTQQDGQVKLALAWSVWAVARVGPSSDWLPATRTPAPVAPPA